MMNRKTFFQKCAVGTAAISLGQLKGSAQGLSKNLGLKTSGGSTVRSLFPMNPERLYLNTGGLGPPSRTVLVAVQEQALKQAIEGENYHSLLNATRIKTAAFFGACPDEICFTRSATEGNSIIAAGLPLKRGDEVIFESHAHPGGSIPWLIRQKEEGIRVKIFEPDSTSPAGNLDRIFSLVTERTRVIQVSHLTAPTGLLFDVVALAKEARRRGIWLHIDGAQSAGMIPIDLHELGCHSYATSGHKWMNGPQETGFLYIVKDGIEEVVCKHGGAYTAEYYQLPDQMTYLPTAQRHEYGTRDAASIAGLEAALSLQEKVGKSCIARHGKELVDKARGLLEEIPDMEILTPSHPDMYNSMLTFRTPRLDYGELDHRLKHLHKIRARQVSEQDLNAVRVSFHLYHNVADVDRLADAVKTALNSPAS